MTSQIENIVKTYKALASIPVLVAAKLVNNGTVVDSVWNQRNLDRGRITKFVRTHMLTPDLKKAGDTLPFDSSGESLVSISPSENLKALVREIEEKDGRKQHLEIWSHSNLTQTVDLSSLDLHGDVYTDAGFGVMRWSPDENKLLYIAEKKEPKKEPFYKRKPMKQDDSKDGEAIKGEQYVYKQDWGEQYVNKKQSVIVQYDLLQDSFKIVEGIPEGLCPMHPIWSPDGTYIVGVALRTTPRKLGLIYCTNRPSAIFTLDFNGNYDEISPEGLSVKCPTFTPDGNTLVWMQRNASGPHHGCMTLVKMNVPLKKKKKTEPTVVVPIVEREKTITGDRKFYGLYNSGFTKRCWASQRRLLLSTNQQTTINTYVVDIDTGAITELVYPSGSQIVLDIHDDVILVNRRCFLYPDKLAIGRLPPKGQEASIEFEEIVSPEAISYLKDYTYEYLDLKYDQSAEVDSFSAIYIGPKTAEKHKVPLIVWPHGGPHSAFANNFALEISLFAASGFAILLVNFRGSIGAGQASVDYLLGKIGDSDVADCVFATNQALEKYPWIDPMRKALVGGSHGGFLVTHISGQHPDMFKAVVARNPVIDVASMSVISDIPDWSSAECGFTYTQVGPLSDEQLLAMRKASPIEHAHKVKAPTLLQVGSKDLRVPHAQATEYFHRLNANGTIVKMNVYDDNHPLGSVNNEVDNLINTLLWIQQYVNIQFGS